MNCIKNIENKPTKINPQNQNLMIFFFFSPDPGMIVRPGTSKNIREYPGINVRPGISRSGIIVRQRIHLRE